MACRCVHPSDEVPAVGRPRPLNHPKGRGRETCMRMFVERLIAGLLRKHRSVHPPCRRVALVRGAEPLELRLTPAAVPVKVASKEAFNSADQVLKVGET